MKKINKYFYLLGIFLSCFFIIGNVKALTINDMLKDLEKLETEKAGKEQEQEKTEQEIAAAKQEMDDINQKIKKSTEDIKLAEAEIEKLKKEIEVKDSQIKDLVAFLQISNSENFYLKYIFGAENFTDLIYRISVIEQLTTKSDELIDEMSNLIEENKSKIEELEQKKVELNKLNKEILVKINELGKEKDKFFDEQLTIDEKIKAMNDQISFYRKQGCKDNQNVSSCTSLIPSSKGFIKPLKSGYISDDYGWRADPCSVCSDFHKGIDLGGNREGTTVMAAASGKVVNIDKYACGGKVLTINHNINGKDYATRYFHLLRINVDVGDMVTQGEKVAEVGGGNTLYYDSCSTGAHLHFEVIEGHYYYSTYYDSIRDPKDYVDFPRGGVYW